MTPFVETRPTFHAERLFAQRLHLDLPLLAALLLLAAVGLIVLYGAGGEDAALLQRQGIRLFIAFAGMATIAQIPPRLLRIASRWLFGFGLALLIAVMAFGVARKGAQRWLDLGFFNIQPAELMKLAVPMMVALYLARRPLPPRLPDLLAASVLILIPTLLIASQPDLGTALLIASSGFFVLFLAGMSWRLIGALAALGAAFLPILWQLMRPYQKERIRVFLNPENDPLGAGYHILQSKIAIGSGGEFGAGWLSGSQSQLEFLPERATDFIFSVFAEEFGLVGVLLLFALYLFIIFRGLYIAAQARETYARLLAGGVTMVFFTYFFVNVGMVSGLLPVVGLPLPLISYGGTSLVTILAGFGMLMSIHTHRKFLDS